MWAERITAAEAATVLRAAMAEGLADGQRSLLVHDLDRMRARIGLLQSTLPALHAVAIKANPLVGVLREVVACGAGLEAASIEEVHLALAAGCPPGRIVYDSPAKTVEELREALGLGLIVNADNGEELARIAQIGPGRVGLRVNPEVGAGRIAATSTAARSSKFGVPVGEADVLLRRYPWVTGLHVHVGSQGIGLEQIAAAARIVDRLRRRHPAIRWVDVGGGLPVSYRGEAVPGLEAWVEVLREAGLDEVELITELGRSLQAPCGFVASRVEYVKGELAVVHVGADLLLRAAYAPSDWSHEVSVLDRAGVPKVGARPVTVVGPLCFSGDVVARERTLPPVEPGDWIVVHDVGAYTLGMWSRHCSRGIPRVLGWDGSFRVLRERESPADVVRFWS